jgi:hypothetical protein
MALLGGLTVTSGRVMATGGVSVADSGVHVRLGGMTIRGAGLQVVDGFSVNAGGMRVTGGLTVRSVGLTSAVAMKVMDGCVRVAGGVTVRTGGVALRATAGLTISSGGFSVTGNSYVRSGGARITLGGLTVANNGINIAMCVSVSGGARLETADIIDGLAVSGPSIVRVGGGIVVNNGDVTSYNSATFNGSVFVDSSPYVASDRRLKTNITAIADPMDKIAALRGVYYNWLSDSDSHDSVDVLDVKSHVGFITQEVRSVLPEAVSVFDSFGHLGVRYDDLIPLIVEAVKELDARTALSAEDSDQYTYYEDEEDDYFEEGEYDNDEEKEDCECKEELLAEIIVMLKELDKLRVESERLTVLMEREEEKRRRVG